MAARARLCKALRDPAIRALASELSCFVGPISYPFLNLPLRLNLSTGDTAALVAFMETLTDLTLANDERGSDPFEQP